MNLSIFSTLIVAGDATVPRLTLQESAALILLASSLLVFRTFRERYLLTWTVGWLAYLMSHWTLRGFLAGDSVPRYLTAISQGEFVLAVGLFTVAILVYSHAQKLILPVMAMTLSVIAFSLVRAWYWPDAFALRVVLEVSYRILLVIAAYRLLRYRWARWEVVPWVLSASLLNRPFAVGPDSTAFTFGFRPVRQPDCRPEHVAVSARRLQAAHAPFASGKRDDQQHHPGAATGSDDGHRPGRAEEAHVCKGGLVSPAGRRQDGPLRPDRPSKDFLRERSAVAKDDDFERTLGSAAPIVVKTSKAADGVRPYLKQEGFHHVVVVPVLGKKSVIGTLALGSRHSLSYSPDEMEFLTTTAHQLGLAVENLRLVEQILRSHRQWTNTFDSIHDLVLLHDSDFRVMKANHALLRASRQSPRRCCGPAL